MSHVRSLLLLERSLIGPARGLRAIAISRVCLGATCSLIYITNWAYRDSFFGPTNVAPPGSAYAFTLPVPWGQSVDIFHWCYTLALLAAICFTIWGGRILAGIHAYLFYQIVINADPFFAEGGDRIASLVLFFFVFMRSDFILTPRRFLLRSKEFSPPRNAAAIMHNAAPLAAAIALASMYFWTAVWKIDGRAWRNGSALHDVLSNKDFAWFVPEPLLHFGPFLSAIGYSVIALELLVSMAIILGSRSPLHACIAPFVFLLHLGILLLMGLFDFSLLMLSMDVLLFRASDLDRWKAWTFGVRDILGRVAPGLVGDVRAPGAILSADPGPRP